MSKTNWLRQIVAIQNKGYRAFLEGIPYSECPYQPSYNGGGSLQRQRRKAWLEGWKQAQKEREEK